jgi:hypothetical protein
MNKENKNDKSFKDYNLFKNRKDIEKSKQCRCYYCLKQFSPSQINQWWDEDEKGIGQTAVCPFCWIDSVIGDNSTEITEEFLLGMRGYWFFPFY